MGGGRVAQVAASGCERRPSKNMPPPTRAQAEFSLGKAWGHPQSGGGGRGGGRKTQAGGGTSGGLKSNLLLKAESAMGSDRVAQGFI